VFETKLRRDVGHLWRFAACAASTFSLLALTSCVPGQGTADAGPACTDTCESLGSECGTVCGRACGVCASDGDGHVLSCLGGLCRCVPVCSPDQCGVDDGCGGICPCATDLTCRDCPIKLVRLDQRSTNGALERVTLALEGSNLAGGTLARMADVRIASSPAMELVAVRKEVLLQDAAKELARFVETDSEFQKLADGSWRVVLLSGPRNADLQPGRWLTLTFVPGENFPAGPVVFSLARQADVMAPAAADQLLQVSAYDAPLTVSPSR